MRNFILALLLISTLAGRARADKVDRLIEADLKKHPIPGLALEIIQNGKCIKRAAYGMANLEWQIPTTPETVFEIGSVTKQFTAAGILMLAQEGRLSVDDKISKYLPDTPASWKDITVRNLLTHTSGLKNFTTLENFELTKHLTQAQFIRQMGQYPLDFLPGEKWAYCNTGFHLAGYIIENVSGSNYWQFMHSRIFGPLGMSATGDRDPRQVIRFRASGYETDGAKHLINRDYDLTGHIGAGAIVSTIDDMAKWNASLDSHALLTAASEKEMWTPGALNNGQTHAYGFGWFLSPLQDHIDIGHSGSTSGFSASIQRFPDDGLAIIVLTNSNEDGIATRVAKEIAPLYFRQRK